MSEEQSNKDYLNSDTTKKTNRLLGLIANITSTAVEFLEGEEYNYQSTTNQNLKQKIKKWNKRIAGMLSKLMQKTTREKDNIEVFKNLNSQLLLNKYWYVVDTADDLMEVSNKNIDKFIKDKKKGDEYEKEVEKAFALKNEAQAQSSSGPSEIIKRTKHYLLKPQLSFEPKMDNSYFQFVPLITHKDNALTELNPRIKQLQKDYLEYKAKNEKFEYNQEGNVVYTKIPNPYEDEITALNLDWNEMVEELTNSEPKMPPPVTETEFQFIDQAEQLPLFIEEISQANEIAVDLEFHSYRSYQGFTWLMQLSTRNKDYVVDTIALRSHLHVLNGVFTNPKIVKILHGSRYDIQWLQKDFGIYVVNLFDTGEAARILGLKASLAYLLKHYCDVDADKQFQLADWRQRPLPEVMLKYAREDTHYLHYIYDVMRKELLTPKKAGESPLVFLKSVWKNSKQLCFQVFQKPKPKDTEYYGIMARNATLMGEGNLQVLDLLLTWRDYVARVEDESVKFVMPNDVMFDIAKSAPKDLTELEVVLRRHPKHTHHELILKYHEDLTTRINKTIAAWTESIKSRVQQKAKKITTVDDFSSSSSSSEEDEEKPKAKPKVPAVAINIDNITVQVNSDQIESKMYENSSLSQQEAKNKHKIERFMQSTGIHTLMGLTSSSTTKAEESNQIEQDLLLQDAEEEKMELDQERKDIVVRVEEVLPKPVSTVEQEIDEDDQQLPKSIGEKYNVTAKAKKGKKSHKRVKTDEETEKASIIQQNKQTVMSQISEIAKKVKDSITNEEVISKKDRKRMQKAQLKSKLNNNEKLNPETWKEMIDKCENVVGIQLSAKHPSNTSKGKKQQKKQQNKRDLKQKVSSKEQKKMQNRFSFLDSH